MVNFADQWVPNGPFPIVADTDVKGGLRVIDWSSVANPDPAAFLDVGLPGGVMPTLRRSVGMIVRLRDTDVAGRFAEMTWNGGSWDRYVSSSQNSLVWDSTTNKPLGRFLEENAPVGPGLSVASVREAALTQSVDYAHGLAPDGCPVENLSGSGASLVNYRNIGLDVVDVTGLTGMTADVVGRYLHIRGAANDAANYRWFIYAFISATSVTVVVPGGLVFAGVAPTNTDANNGAIDWSLIQGTFDPFTNPLAVTSPGLGLATLTGMSGMSPASVGRTLSISGAVNAGNNGHFLITEYVSATSVKIANPLAVAEAAGSIKWVERYPWQPYGTHSTFGVVEGFVVTNPVGTRQDVSAGVFVCPDGKKFLTGAMTVAFSSTSGSTFNRVMRFDRFMSYLNPISSSFDPSDFIISRVTVTGHVTPGLSFLTNFWSIVPRHVDSGSLDEIVVAGPVNRSHFDDLGKAMAWSSSSSVKSARKIKIISDFSITTEPEAMPGTVSVTALGVVSGTGTRLRRDFGVGDWIKIGSAWGKVATITADDGASVMTLTGYAGGIQTAVAYTRANFVGPHSRLPSFGSAEGVEVYGFDIVNLGRPTMLWGDVGVDETAPGLDLNSTEQVKLRDFIIQYQGALNGAVNHDHCGIKDPKNTYLQGIQVLGQHGLFHAVRCGASAGPSGAPGLHAVGCEFNNFSGTDSSVIFSEEATGNWTFKRCSFSNGFGSNYEFVYECTEASDVNDNVYFDDCEIEDVEIALVLHNATFEDSRKVFSNCVFGIGAAAVKVAVQSRVGPVDARRVELIQCAFNDDWDMEGTHIATACFNIDAAADITMNGVGMFIGCDFTTFGSVTGTPIARFDSTMTRTSQVLFSQLPSAVTSGVGARMMIIDCNTAVFNANAAGGGVIIVPVFSDGAVWKVG